jgi:hypothetical protein
MQGAQNMKDSSFLFFFFFFWWDGSLNSGLHTCEAGFLLLEPNLQFTLHWLF